VYPFQGKRDLLGHLEPRLLGYAQWLPADWRVVVVVDRDDEDCLDLKRKMQEMARRSGLRLRGSASTETWQLVNRIAIEELEAWYFGDWKAVSSAFPRVSATVPGQARYRDPDRIAGGTWEAFERVMQAHGYFKGGLPKIEAARAIGAHVDPARSTSQSFRVFAAGIADAIA
jgi:hypothetical protein